MLLTVSIFALTGMIHVSEPATTRIDEFFGFVAAFSIFAAALLVDYALDTKLIETGQRFKFLNFGYVSFCFAVGIMTMPFLYAELQAQGKGFRFIWLDWPNIPFPLAGLAVFCKMMFLKDYGIFSLLMVLFYGWSIFALYMGS
jgi:hypothetical protein